MKKEPENTFEVNMKKLIMTILTVLTCGATYALPVGNPSEASLLIDGLFWEGNCCGDICNPCCGWFDSFSLRAGFYGDYVFKDHWHVSKSPFGNNDKAIEHVRMITNAGYLALNFCDRLDIFSSLGETHLLLDASSLALTDLTSTGRAFLKTDSQFSWSIGGRLTLWECGCTALGIEGQYFRYNPHLTRLTIADPVIGVASVYPGEHVRLHLSEWQAGLGISHRINILVPYIAVKYSRAHVKLPREIFLIGTEVVELVPHLNSDTHWGWALGVSLVDCEKAAVTVEGRWGNERALYVNGQIRF
jgi:major outer membrane protein